jgi:2-dehydro-3-deoxygluconokinase
VTDRIVCFGEVLLRLGAPGRRLLLQQPQFDVYVGGAEANVAVSLARFGHATEVLGTISDNALGDAALGELRRHGVRVDRIRRTDGRMGLYFLAQGAGSRPSEVLYDRRDSAFARAGARDYDWPRLLDGARLLHVSGVTPALGADAAEAVAAAARAARARGATVSFDGNFRAKLWAAWDGDPSAILHGLVAHAHIAFADHRDIGVILGEDTEPVPAATDEPGARFAAASARAFAAFPALQRIATTVRTQHTVDDHSLGALMATRNGDLHAAPSRALHGIVDRIGAGDAFAAGVLHGQLTGMGDAESLRFGLAAACLKHTIPGDFNLAGIADVHALMQDARLDVKR